MGAEKAPPVVRVQGMPFPAVPMHLNPHLLGACSALSPFSSTVKGWGESLFLSPE